MSLISALIQLSTTETETIPLRLGKANHAWFLSQIRRFDPQLAEALHVPNQERPFTVSELWGPGVRRNAGNRRTTPNTPIYLRITSVSPRLTDLLLERVLPSLPEVVSLMETPYRVETFFLTPDQIEDRKLQVWVGQTTFEHLVARYTLQSRPPRRLRLQFASPTVFRSQNAYLPLPLPRLVFEGLVRKWNAFSPIQVHPDVNRYAEETMVISSYRLHTEIVRFGEGEKGIAYPGFVGQCSFALRHYDRYWMGLAHLLAAFALYAGVGKNTAMGFGQTRLLTE